MACSLMAPRVDCCVEPGTRMTAPGSALTDEQRRLVEDNTRLIWWQIKRWRIPADRRDDAFQDGVFGLARAAQKFDPDRGLQFSTYATVWIRQAIRRGAEFADRNFHRAKNIGADYERPLSLDGMEDAAGDRIPSHADTERSAVDAVAASELAAAVLKACRDDLDRAILYEALTGTQGTLADVARDWGVTRQAVANRARRLGLIVDPARAALPEGDPRHGTPNGYVNWGCRCTRCGDAQREAKSA